MANGFNRVELIGNLGDEPVVRQTSTGSTVANISLAINETRRDQSGNLVSETEWVRVVAFGRTADIMQQYLHKGSQVHIEGKIRTRSYEDKNGEKRYSTEVVCEPNGLLMLGRASDQGFAGASQDNSSGGWSNASHGQYDNQQGYSRNAGGYNNAQGQYGGQNSAGQSGYQRQNQNQYGQMNQMGNPNQNAFSGANTDAFSQNRQSNAGYRAPAQNSFGNAPQSGGFAENPDNAGDTLNDDLPF